MPYITAERLPYIHTLTSAKTIKKHLILDIYQTK